MGRKSKLYYGDKVGYRARKKRIHEKMQFVRSKRKTKIERNNYAASSSEDYHLTSTSAENVHMEMDGMTNEFLEAFNIETEKSIELDDQTQRVKKLDVNLDQSIDDGEAFFTDIKEETTPVQEFMDSLEDSTMEVERSAPSISKSDKNAMKSSKKRKLSSQYAGINTKPGTCPYCSKDLPVSSSSRSQTVNNGEQNFNTESGLDANVVFRVYDFLQREYECLQASNTAGFDLSPLANILKRTADATGYNEQTVATILSTRYKKDLHDVSIKIEHNYIDQSNREEHSINDVDIGDHGMDEETQDELVLKCEVSEEVINKPSCSNKSVTDAKQIHIKVEPEDTYPNKWADSANDSVRTQVHDNEVNEDSYPTKWSGCSYKSVKGPQIQIKLEPDEDQCSITESSLNAAESESSILELTPVIETDRSTSENALYLEVSPLPLSTSSSLNPVEIDVPVTEIKIEPQNDLSLILKKRKKREEDEEQMVGAVSLNNDKDQWKKSDEIERKRSLQNKIRCKRYREKKKRDETINSRISQPISVEDEIIIRRRKELSKLRSKRYRDKKRASNLINLQADKPSKVLVKHVSESQNFHTSQIPGPSRGNVSYFPPTTTPNAVSPSIKNELYIPISYSDCNADDLTDEELPLNIYHT